MAMLTDLELVEMVEDLTAIIRQLPFDPEAMTYIREIESIIAAHKREVETAIAQMEKDYYGIRSPH